MLWQRWLLLVSLLVPIRALSQPLDCPGCVLGLYDDPAMTQSTGLPTGGSKELYLGIRFPAGVPDGLTVVEFGIAGLEPFAVKVEPLHDPNIVLGDPRVPAGVDTLQGTGGMNIAWPVCLTGDRLVAKLTLEPLTEWPQGAALRVVRRYPPGNPNIPFPTIARCDAPFFTAVGVSGNTYLLGPNTEPECVVTAPTTSFGLVPLGRHATRTFTVENAGYGVLAGRVAVSAGDFALLPTFDPNFLLTHGQAATYALRFAPTMAAAQACTVAIGDGCRELTFTGNTPDVVSIRTLQDDPTPYLGQEVVVEGQPYRPPTGPPYFWQGWLQDADRGLRLSGAIEAPWRILFQATDRVQVQGRVGRTSEGLLIENVSHAFVVSSGHPLVSAVRVLTGTLSDPALTGTYVQVQGRVVGIEPGSQYRYWIDDGSGLALARAPADEAISLQDIVIARGTAAGGATIAVYETEGLFETGRLDIAVAHGSLGEIVDIPIRMEGNAEPVGEFGFRFRFDARALEFVELLRGAGTANWTNVEGASIEPDVIRVAASHTVPIAPGFAGDLVIARLRARGCGPGAFQIGEPTGDIVAMGNDAAWFTCADCPGDGDVSGDGTLTPMDALCAFETFLGDGATPPRCDVAGACEAVRADVDCDGRVLPGDALMIFQRWLWNIPTPQPCMPPHSALTQQASLRFDPQRATRIGDRTLIPLERRQLAGDAAFAARIQFDAQAAEFVEFEPAATTSAWTGLDARSRAPGQVLLGGFAAGLQRDDDPAAWEVLGALVFRRVATAEFAPTIEWLEQVRIDPQQQPEPEPDPGVDGGTFAVGMPHPNPMHGDDMATLNLSLPRQRTPVVARVLDVRGRLIRHLEPGPDSAGSRQVRWDGRDARGGAVAAGLYVVEIRAGDRTERRKVVVLR